GATRKISAKRPFGRLKSGARKQKVKEAFSRGLRLMIGQAWSLIRLDEDILCKARRSHHEVDADHGNIDCAGSFARCLHQRRVDLLRHVMDGASRMQVRCLAHDHCSALSGHGAKFQALTGQAASRLRIHGNGAFSTSSSRTAAGLMPDEIFDRTGTVSHNARGPPYGSGDETVVNYYQPQV